MHKHFPFSGFSLVILFYLTFQTVWAQTLPEIKQNTIVQPASLANIPIVWVSDSINGKRDAYTAMLVPVKIAGISKLFYMQLDLGMPYSVFYSNKLKSIEAKYSGRVHFKDSLTKVGDFALQIGTEKIQIKEMYLRNLGNTDIDWANQSKKEIIGSIGTDFILNKSIVFDYPHNKLSIFSTLPDNLLSQLELSDFVFARNSILLPAVLQNKKIMLYFDTGSSAYELLTSKEVCQSLADNNAIPVQYKVKSWGRELTANTLPTKDSITIINQKIPIRNVTFIEGASESQVQQMLKLGIGGMTGNKLFLNSILVIDTKNKKFGILKSR
jgi:hypothetical protein